MRNLPLLLALLLVSALGVAATAQASLPPLPDQVRPLLAEEEEAEFEEAEGEESDECLAEDEEDAQFCAEVAEEERESEEGQECAVEDATAKLIAKPGAGSFGLIIRYRASTPTAVAIDARLRGGKGGVHLGASRARFRRSGTFRDSFSLSEREMERALAAREFLVEVRAVNSPRHCRLDLSGALRLARR